MSTEPISVLLADLSAAAEVLPWQQFDAARDVGASQFELGESFPLPRDGYGNLTEASMLDIIRNIDVHFN
jgi:hypothetical protein